MENCARTFSRSAPDLASLVRPAKTAGIWLFRSQVADLSHRRGFTADAQRRAVAAFVLQRNPGHFSRQPLTDQPRNLDGGFVVAEALAMDIGDAIAVGVGETDLRRERQIGPH